MRRSIVGLILTQAVCIKVDSKYRNEPYPARQNGKHWQYSFYGHIPADQIVDEYWNDWNERAGALFPKQIKLGDEIPVSYRAGRKKLAPTVIGLFTIVKMSKREDRYVLTLAFADMKRKVMVPRAWVKKVSKGVGEVGRPVVAGELTGYQIMCAQLDQADYGFIFLESEVHALQVYTSLDAQADYIMEPRPGTGWVLRRKG